MVTDRAWRGRSRAWSAAGQSRCHHNKPAVFECRLRRSEQAYGEPRACRRRTRETRRAEASEAAFSAIAAKALVKTWKKPCLSPGQTCLPVELWGLVLEQLLPDDSLWDLRATVQELCNLGMACKGLHTAVQQHGWPQLCRLFICLCPPPSTQKAWSFEAKAAQKARLPASPDVLVTNPTSLPVPDLRAACAYFGLSSSGALPAAVIMLHA